MFDAFAEGVRSIVQVCHLVILAPVVLTVLAARGRWQAVAGSVAGIVVGGWFFVSDRFGNITDLELRGTAAFVIVGVGLLAFSPLLDRDRPAWARRVGEPLRSPTATFAISASVATVVTQWWRPCVGVELGAILTDAPRDPIGQIPSAAGFMLGIAVPIVVIGLAYTAWNPRPAQATRLAWFGAGSFGLLAASVIAGQHGEIVSRLFQWSQ